LTSQGFPLPPLLIACRPRQWPKNLLVFAAPLFAFRSEPELWLRAAVALVAFCLISSGIYLINDCLDVAADRAHPSKCRRPIAAGLVSVPAALSTATLLAAASLSLAASISMALAAVVLLYGLIQLGYCLQFKRMPLLDLFCIASGFLLRAIAGAVAAMLPSSPLVPAHGGPAGAVPGDREAQGRTARGSGSGRDHESGSGALLTAAVAPA
jgi:4-hydroxybenzoate polyprenyltransferase